MQDQNKIHESLVDESERNSREKRTYHLLNLQSIYAFIPGKKSL